MKTKTILIIAIILGLILLIIDAQAGQTACGDKIYDQTTGKCINQ